MITANTYRVGPYLFAEVIDHGFRDIYPNQSLWIFTIDGGDRGTGLFPTLDHAMVAAVGERHTGRRGAGGIAVDTAAGWFMRMIGAPRS